MKINYHPVGIKMSDALKAQFEKKLGRVTHLFHNVTQVDLFLKVERTTHILELLINADDEKFYLSRQAEDMYKCMDLLLEKAFENVRKAKSRQHHHHSPRFVHHNHLVLTKNLGPHRAEEEEMDVFSSKPLSLFEAYLELKASGENLLIFRVLEKNRIGSLNLMLAEKDGFFLIRRETPFLGIFGRRDRFLQHRFEYRGDRYTVLKRQQIRVEAMDPKAVRGLVEKQGFCFYLSDRTHDFSVMFKYGRNRIGLVEHIEVR